MIFIHDAITIYGQLLSSINTIWNIYVFVLLGMVGWILARANEFSHTQKILITIVFTIFNTVILFYFFDAYYDVDKVRIELLFQKNAKNLLIVKNGISDDMISFDPFDRFIFVASFVVGFWMFVLIIVWSKKIWAKS